MKNRFPITPNSDLAAAAQERAAAAFHEKTSAENLIIVTNDGLQIPVKPESLVTSGEFLLVESAIVKNQIAIRMATIVRISARTDSEPRPELPGILVGLLKVLK